MTDKSFVTLEQHLCEVCCNPYDTGSLLLDRRMRKTFEHKTVTGINGLCPACQEKHDAGYIALVEASNPRTPVSGDRLKQEDAHRTGRIFHVRRHVVEAWFQGVPTELPMVFIDTEVGDMLEKRFAKIEQTAEPDV